MGLPFDALPRYSDTLDHEGESSLSPDHRTALARALEFSDDDRVEGELLALLEDSDDSVAAVVAQALGTVSGVSVVPALRTPAATVCLPRRRPQTAAGGQHMQRRVSARHRRD